MKPKLTELEEETDKHTQKFLSQYSVEQVDKLSGRIQNINCVWICLEADAKIGFNMKVIFVEEGTEEGRCIQTNTVLD